MKDKLLDQLTITDIAINVVEAVMRQDYSRAYENVNELHDMLVIQLI